EVRAYAELMLAELRRVIPAFLKRVDLPERGGAWSRYLAATRAATQEVAARLLDAAAPEPREEVTLTDFDPEGEVKVVAAALYAVSALPDDELLERARKMTHEERRAVLDAYVGERLNRRHRPGRAFERTSYRFDILGDYGAFRDLQRHRLLTLEWQRLTPHHGSVMPEAVAEVGAEADWTRVLGESAELHDAIVAAGLSEVASYAVAMAYRVRFYMEMNAREAMHVIELRTTPQGHPAYRRICQAMHRLIAERAGHRAIAAAMTFADHSADKRAILVAALEMVMADLDRRVAAAQARGPRDPRARLRALITACLRLATEAREFWVVFVEFWGEMMHDRRLREINAALYRRVRRQIGALVAQGIEAGTFRRVDVVQAAAVVLALVDGVSLQLTFDPRAFGAAAAVRLCEDALTRYLEKEAP